MSQIIMVDPPGTRAWLARHEVIPACHLLPGLLDLLGWLSKSSGEGMGETHRGPRTLPPPRGCLRLAGNPDILSARLQGHPVSPAWESGEKGCGCVWRAWPTLAG